MRNAWITALNKRFRPRLVVLRLRGFSLMFGNQPRIENALPIVCGIKAAIEGEVGSTEIYTNLFGHFFQRFQALR